MYAFDSRIRYSETDSEGYLTLDALLNYFQDCSTFHSEDVGLGIGYMKEIGQVCPFLLADRGEPLSEIRGKSKDRDAAL